MLLLTVFRVSEGFKDFDICHHGCWFNLATTILHYGVYFIIITESDNNIVRRPIYIII